MGTEKNHTHDVGVCMCSNEEGKECTCSHEAPHEHEAEKVAGTHSHHSHHAKTFSERINPYSRLITTLVVVLAFGIIYSLYKGFSWMSVMEYWMGGYFLAFGIQQAISLKKSAAMFRQYDLLAMRIAVYSYALPFIQIGLGIAYILMIWWLPVGLISLAILLVSVFGVDRVIQQKKMVRCGCLGEGMNVPVGKVTLWENLIMIGMVVMMLTYHAMNYLVLGGNDMTSMPGMRM